MTAYAERRTTGRYRFRQVALMEWIKLRSLRSTWWTLGITGASAIGFGIVVGLNTKNAGGDLTNNTLSGVIVGLLLMGVLGVLVATSEYTSGLIQSTLAAAPRRWLMLAGKAGVFGGVALLSASPAGGIQGSRVRD
jgi:ABC-2 type transport system permease protein